MMKKFLLIDSILCENLYFVDEAEFSFCLFAKLCGLPKVLTTHVDDNRARCVIEIVGFAED